MSKELPRVVLARKVPKPARMMTTEICMIGQALYGVRPEQVTVAINCTPQGMYRAAIVLPSAAVAVAFGDGVTEAQATLTLLKLLCRQAKQHSDNILLAIDTVSERIDDSEPLEAVVDE